MAGSNKEGSWRGMNSSSKKDPELWVQFSPKLLDRLSQLDKAVRDSKHFNSDILENLRECTAEPMTANRAVSAIAHITREAMRYVAATSDKAADYALIDLMEAISSDHPPCVQPVKMVRKSR